MSSDDTVVVHHHDPMQEILETMYIAAASFLSPLTSISPLRLD